MLTREEDIDAHALRARGWTISAIARHLGRDRKTIRTYLSGGQRVGVRARTVPDPFEPFVAYCAARLTEDPHLWASTLYDELLELGYHGSYPTLTRQLRNRALRPPAPTGSGAVPAGARAGAGAWAPADEHGAAVQHVAGRAHPRTGIEREFEHPAIVAGAGRLWGERHPPRGPATFAPPPGGAARLVVQPIGAQPRYM